MIKRIKRNIIAVLGILITSAAFNIFLVPNDLAAGDVSGLALIFNDLYGIDISMFVLISNILLILLAFCVFGKKAAAKTVIGCILSPIFIKITSPLSYIIDVSETELIVQAIFGGVISGIGGGLVFKQGYNTGGTDVLNLVMTEKYKLPISISIIVIDGAIVLLGGLVFGLEKMIYAIIALILTGIYSNKALIGIGNNKNFYIYTSKPHQVKDYLINITKNDVTILNGQGGYTSKNIKILMSVISTSDYYKVKKGILHIDPKAFVVVNESYELVNGNRNITIPE